jgi:hypothetical protein
MISDDKPTLSARNAQNSGAAYHEPLASLPLSIARSSALAGESTSLVAPTYGPGPASFSFPASGFGGASTPGAAAPTGGFSGIGGGQSFSLPAFSHPGVVAPTGVGASGTGGGEKPSFSFVIPTQSGAGVSLPTGGPGDFPHHHHHHHYHGESGASGALSGDGGLTSLLSGGISGIAAPTGSFTRLTEGGPSGVAAPTGGFSGPSNTPPSVGIPTATYGLAHPTESF